MMLEKNRTEREKWSQLAVGEIREGVVTSQMQDRPTLIMNLFLSSLKVLLHEEKTVNRKGRTLKRIYSILQLVEMEISQVDMKKKGCHNTEGLLWRHVIC